MRRELVDYARAQHGASLRMACRTIGISDTSYRYRPDPHRDDEVIAKLQEAVERYPAYGFDKLFKIAPLGSPMEPQARISLVLFSGTEQAQAW